MPRRGRRMGGICLSTTLAKASDRGRRWTASICRFVDTRRRSGNRDYWVVAHVFGKRGSLERIPIGDIGRCASYARTWRLVRRCPPLRKKAHQNSGPIDRSAITLPHPKEVLQGPSIQLIKASLSSEPRPLYSVSQQARSGIGRRREWFHNQYIRRDQ